MGSHPLVISVLYSVTLYLMLITVYVYKIGMYYLEMHCDGCLTNIQCRNPMVIAFDISKSDRKYSLIKIKGVY